MNGKEGSGGTTIKSPVSGTVAVRMTNDCKFVVSTPVAVIERNCDGKTKNSSSFMVTIKLCLK